MYDKNKMPVSIYALPSLENNSGINNGQTFVMNNDRVKIYFPD